MILLLERSVEAGSFTVTSLTFSRQLKPAMAGSGCSGYLPAEQHCVHSLFSDHGVSCFGRGSREGRYTRMEAQGLRAGTLGVGGRSRAELSWRGRQGQKKQPNPTSMLLPPQCHSALGFRARQILPLKGW